MQYVKNADTSPTKAYKGRFCLESGCLRLKPVKSGFVLHELALTSIKQTYRALKNPK